MSDPTQPTRPAGLPSGAELMTGITPPPPPPTPPPAVTAAQASTPTAATQIAVASEPLSPTAATRVAFGPQPSATAPTVVATASALSAPNAAADPGKILDTLIGSEIGGCHITSLLGRGGMGAVFRATQRSLQRDIALKIMLPGRDGDPQFADRFEREARVVAQLNHPHVVQVFEAGRDPASGMLYMLMEFVSGRTLGQVIKQQGALTAAVALEIFRQAADGLAAAHAKTLIHRDIKPDNLMIGDDGRLKIMDFGLARAAQSANDSGLTMSGTVLGTPSYMSPEAARGEPSDMRSDLYSLGVTLWQALAGKLPFTAATPVQVMAMHLESPPPPLDRHAPGCPPQVVALCHRLLEKDAAKRFSQPTELREAIQSMQRALGCAGGTLRWQAGRLQLDGIDAASAIARPNAGGGRRAPWLIAGGLLAAGVAAGGLWFALGNRGEAGAGPGASNASGTTNGASGGNTPQSPGTPAIASDGAAGASATTAVSTTTARSVAVAGVTPGDSSRVAQVPAPTPQTASIATAGADSGKTPTAHSGVPTLGTAPTTPAHPTTPTNPQTNVAQSGIAPTPSPQPPIAPTAIAPTGQAVRLDAVPSLRGVPASLGITSVPAGAQIWIHGIQRSEVTPTLIRGVQPGAVSVRLVMPGGAETTIQSFAIPGRVVRISDQGDDLIATLELIGTERYPEATLSIDGLPYAAGMRLPSATVSIVVTRNDQRTAFAAFLKQGRNVIALP